MIQLHSTEPADFLNEGDTKSKESGRIPLLESQVKSRFRIGRFGDVQFSPMSGLFVPVGGASLDGVVSDCKFDFKFRMGGHS